MSSIHDDILEGEGTKESPFVMAPVRYWFSTIAQKAVIDKLFGEGSCQPDGPRLYHESPRSIFNNQDLCQHLLIVDGREVSIWFDLSNVTKFELDPRLRRARAGLREMLANHPNTPRVQARIRNIINASKSDSCEAGQKERITLWDFFELSLIILATVWVCSRFGWIGLLTFPLLGGLANLMRAMRRSNSSPQKAMTSAPPSPQQELGHSHSNDLLGRAMESQYQQDLVAEGRTGSESDAKEHRLNWVLRKQHGLVPVSPQKQPNQSGAVFYRRIANNSLKRETQSESSKN